MSDCLPLWLVQVSHVCPLIGSGVHREAAVRPQPSLPGRHLSAVHRRQQPFCFRRERQPGSGLEFVQVMIQNSRVSAELLSSSSSRFFFLLSSSFSFFFLFRFSFFLCLSSPFSLFSSSSSITPSLPPLHHSSASSCDCPLHTSSSLSSCLLFFVLLLQSLKDEPSPPKITLWSPSLLFLLKKQAY